MININTHSHCIDRTIVKIKLCSSKIDLLIITEEKSLGNFSAHK